MMQWTWLPRRSPSAVFTAAALLLATAVLMSTGVPARAAARHQNEDEAGFVPLFNGTSLDGWQLRRAERKGFVVEDGLLVCPEGSGGYLFTTKEYADFALRFEFRMEEGANSGVAIRSPLLDRKPAYQGTEIQILDDSRFVGKLRATQYHGSIYDVVPAKRGALKPVGQWNQQEIVCKGRQITVKVNGQIVVDANLDDVKDTAVLEKHPGLQRASGYIGFLGHGDRVEFRRVRLKELRESQEEADDAPTATIHPGEGADDMVFPGRVWEEVTPESQGVDSAKLQAAVDYLREHAGQDGAKRMVIVRNGRMIWRGPEAAKAQGVWSVTKAFTSTAHGLLIEDGKCTLDTLAKDLNPALAKYYPTVTLRHFATMTSGLDGEGGGYDWDDQRRGDQNALVEPLPPFFPPGTKYMYWDEATQHYGYTLTQIAGEPLKDYLKKRVFDPIGITKLDWKPDATGEVLNWTGGIEISAEDLARFGLLFLNRGNWNGRQLISADWVDQATRVQVPASIPNALPTSSRKGAGVYGYHWWPNGITPEGRRRWPDAPRSTYSRSGYNNNDLFVIPAWNMVTVRLGLDQREDEITTAEYNTFLRIIGEAIPDAVVDGELREWRPVAVCFRGPTANETDDQPNPFLDYRLQVVFTGPSGQRYDVPGFFDGDGHGGATGDVWRARFAPDEAGRWSYQASFRTGKGIAVSLDPEAGRPVAFDGARGSFNVAPCDPNAPGFLKWGRLEYAGAHYLKFAAGPYWIRGGTDSPENFLAYAGFDRTPPSHHYAAHVPDWRPGDPDWGERKGRGIIGAINYLAAHGVNSVYLLTHNIGGDGKDVWPWAGSPDPKGSPRNDNLHYDVGKLRQWETVFAHAQRQGVFLHFVLNEAEEPNKRELDDGELGTERMLYYRELIARFGHHLALQWNLCEEYNLGLDLGPDRVRRFADYVQAIDPYDHPITVHSAGDPLEALRFTFGDPRFSLTSIQLGQHRIDSLAEQFREATAESGRPLPVSLDEFTLDKGQEQGWIPVDDAERWRVEKLWPTYLSGGNIEFILGDLLESDSFKTPQRERLWDYVLYARRFLEALPFWEMQPADQLVTGAAGISVTQNRGRKTYSMGVQVYAKPAEIYAVYLPRAENGAALDLSGVDGRFQQRWYSPRTGEFEGPAVDVAGASRVLLGKPPRETGKDWAVLIKKAPSGRAGR